MIACVLFKITQFACLEECDILVLVMGFGSMAKNVPIDGSIPIWDPKEVLQCVEWVGQWVLQHFATYFRGWIWEMRPQRSQGTSVYRGIHHSWIIQNHFAFWFQIIDYQNTSKYYIQTTLINFAHLIMLQIQPQLQDELIRGIQPSAAGLWNGVPNSERIHPWWSRVNLSWFARFHLEHQTVYPKKEHLCKRWRWNPRTRCRFPWFSYGAVESLATRLAGPVDCLYGTPGGRMSCCMLRGIFTWSLFWWVHNHHLWWLYGGLTWFNMF